MPGIGMMKLGTKLIKILDINPENYQLKLEYSDKFKGIISLDFIFSNPEKKPLVLEILRGNLFQRCFIESGALAWPNGYELCPDMLRHWIAEQNKLRKKVA